MVKDRKIILRIIKNRLFEFIIFIFSVSLIVPLFLMIFMIVQKGISVINWDFLFMERRVMGSATGGILKDIIGTLILIGLTVSFSVPLGILSGIYLAENRKSKIAFVIQWAIDILQGVPSVVIGLIVSIWFVKSQILGPSALAGAIALSFMMLPVVIKSTEETIKLIPHIYKEASIALGVPYYKTILLVILPSSLSGIVTGVLLGVARIAGETAPLLFTAFGNNFMNTNIFKPMNSLPQLIYNYSMDASPKSHATAWGASFVLISIILILNLISKVVVKKWKIKF
ncbi:MAG: phosphate ABC transporter, permease protein PstA [Spirochaetes bacterium GWF1_31_7]|nr:MAG: phosphate ABC transporter, permease protein PstA [Spirochaetes bacterium GWE1_32_154]OHD51886.1 MAG: phosphate ABC transporter, permease protein PstA [Spirochaetes bacterium GWE2_31_10]OHD52993.1 MAG: phosphate ABC transporter, permease protein PstA [Spirochaetes bacterium GWF1_31_7]OHD78870.1 MAG: phosphate ABC transporter, permease protein PstA [Spirochaetes bacterium RIFOXYB1_FULL_32_8]HBD95851.1 phosphate ABC transporter permease PtsA [Spirochaetia bacterium]